MSSPYSGFLIAEVAARKLMILNAALTIENLRVPLGDQLEALKRERKDSIPFAWTISTASASSGATGMLTTLRYWITTDVKRWGMARKVFAIHPGEVLSEEFMKPLGLTAYRVAKDLDVPVPRVNDIVRGKRSISADTAVRLGAYFGLPAQFWMNLQADYDLRLAGAKIDFRKIKVCKAA
jgi:antitoxin HigA-1